MAKQFSYTALTTLAASGSSANIALDSLESEVSVYMGAAATWGGGTAILQESYDAGVTWLSHPTFTFTAGVASTFLGKAIVHAPLVRVTLSGATSPSLQFNVKVATVRYPTLFATTFAANGSSANFLLPTSASVAGSTVTVNGDQEVSWLAQGTWGSGTLVLQTSPDAGVTWFNVDAGITANTKKLSKPITDSLCRLTLTGATSPVLSAWVVL
jgi:hypothetical protein